MTRVDRASRLYLSGLIAMVEDNVVAGTAGDEGAKELAGPFVVAQDAVGGIAGDEQVPGSGDRSRVQRKPCPSYDRGAVDPPELSGNSAAPLSSDGGLLF